MRPGHRNHDAQMFRRQATGHPIGPLQQTNAFPRKVFVRSEIEKLRLGAQAIGIEVINRQAAVVLLDEHEGGTGDSAAVRDAQPFGDGADQVRLAGAQLSDKADDGTGEENVRQPQPEVAGGGFVNGVKIPGCDKPPPDFPL